MQLRNVLTLLQAQMEYVQMCEDLSLRTNKNIDKLKVHRFYTCKILNVAFISGNLI
jgi:hypothetical protein